MCNFVPIKPLDEDLLYIFNDTDCDKDMLITWHEFADFVKNIFIVRGLYSEFLS